MLPFLKVLNVGIVAAFAAIEEIPMMIDTRIDRKKTFLALSDTPPFPAFFFLTCLCNLHRRRHRNMPSHITYWKTILARYSSFLGIACEITPYCVPLLSPSIDPSIAPLPFRLSSKLCVPSGDTGRFDLTGRCLVSWGFTSAALSIFVFPSLLCRLLSS